MLEHTGYHEALSDRINKATRKEHTHLNRMIISRLFQALPPNTGDAMKYLQGIMHLTTIFYRFEYILRDMTLDARQILESRYSLQNLDLLQHWKEANWENEERKLILASIIHDTFRVDQLARSPRLFEDAKFLMQNQESCQHFSVLKHFAENQLRQESETLATDKLRDDPHLLLAHIWCLYMACKSGGQLIRQMLLSVPTEFWLKKMKYVNGPDYRMWMVRRDGVSFHGLPEAPTIKAENTDELSSQLPGFPVFNARSGIESNFFTFWEVKSDEPTKDELREAMKQVESLLSDEQKLQVIEEAKLVFEEFDKFVHKLDKMCGTNMDKLSDRDDRSWFRQATRPGAGAV